MSLEEELNEMEEMNKVYYKIIERGGELLGVCCLQWFDEYDYDQNRFLVDENDIQYKFDDEDKAKKWLNNNIKPEYIDPEDRILNNKFNREKYFK